MTDKGTSDGYAVERVARRQRSAARATAVGKREVRTMTETAMITNSWQCRHGLDLRVHARCYLCRPDEAPVKTTTSSPTPPRDTSNLAPWCPTCVRYHFPNAGPCNRTFSR